MLKGQQFETTTAADEAAVRAKRPQINPNLLGSVQNEKAPTDAAAEHEFEKPRTVEAAVICCCDDVAKPANIEGHTQLSRDLIAA